MRKQEWTAVLLGIVIFMLIYLLLWLISFHTAFEYLLELLGFIFIVLLGIMVLKMFFHRNKKGMNIFEKKEIPRNNEIIISSLNKIKEAQEVIEVENGVVVKNRSGVYLIKMIGGKGILKGSLESREWYLNNAEIPNPFDQKADYYYLIRIDSLSYQVSGVKVVTLSEMVFSIENNLLNKAV